MTVQKNPHFMSYEVVELRLASPVQTVFTSESYDEAFDVWEKLFDKNGHARMDLVVRERKTGVPLFRTVVLEMERAGAHGDMCNGKPAISSCYNVSDWGRFSPGVYNHDYKDKSWAGYEAYSKPLTLFHFNDSTSTLGC